MSYAQHAYEMYHSVAVEGESKGAPSAQTVTLSDYGLPSSQFSQQIFPNIEQPYFDLKRRRPFVQGYRVRAAPPQSQIPRAIPEFTSSENNGPSLGNSRPSQQPSGTPQVQSEPGQLNMTGRNSTTGKRKQSKPRMNWENWQVLALLEAKKEEYEVATGVSISSLQMLNGRKSYMFFNRRGLTLILPN
ncbi:hypothetical protein R1flu_021142 [Riccia fluitans]|uniref:Uncharacterized protein n=1 Tax=Riccia fluitans TaxID=41844 RepID=A0ABD1ZS71_9MARC